MKVSIFFNFVLLIAIFTSTNIYAQQLFITSAVIVNVNSEWTDSGIHISSGDTVFMNGFGAFSPWDTGDGWYDMSNSNFKRGTVTTVPGFPGSTIIARIGESDTLIASGPHWFISDSDGNLFFTVNDESGQYSDNRGTVMVMVFIKNVGSTNSINLENYNNEANYKIRQNYPNPFNPSTTIEYEIQNAGIVEIKIFDELGQGIRTLVNDNKDVGFHSVIWDGKSDRGSQVSTGAYFYQLKVNNFVSTKKMILLK